MSGILFLLAIVAFIVVAHWAYTNDRAKSDSGELGVLGMKTAQSSTAESIARNVPKWRRSSVRQRRGPVGAEKTRAAPARSMPRWKTIPRNKPSA